MRSHVVASFAGIAASAWFAGPRGVVVSAVVALVWWRWPAKAAWIVAGLFVAMAVFVQLDVRFTTAGRGAFARQSESAHVLGIVAGVWLATWTIHHAATARLRLETSDGFRPPVTTRARRSAWASVCAGGVAAVAASQWVDGGPSPWVVAAAAAALAAVVIRRRAR